MQEGGEMLAGQFKQMLQQSGAESYIKQGLHEQMAWSTAAAMKVERAEAMQADAWRSLMFVLLAAVALWGYIERKVITRPAVLCAVLAIVVAADLINIDFRYLNYDRDATQFGIPTLDEIFARYKNRCFINIDKFWLYPKEITDLIRKHDMVDQIVVKTAPKKELFDLIEEYAPEIAYLPILKNVDGGVHEELMSRNINYVGAELVFNTLDCEIGGTEYIDRLHADNKLVWANAIIYNYKAQLSAGHSDDSSIEIDPETGWGWLADRGYDIIQTDWTLAMRIYLESTGRLFKK
jgi:hypothetical protein